MQNLIVLGIIPGTNIQTNLNFWMFVVVLVALFAFRMQFIAMRNFVQLQLTVRKIAHTINSFELASPY